MTLINLRVLLCWFLTLGFLVGYRVHPAELMPATRQQHNGTGTDSKLADLSFKETMVGEAATSEGFRYPIHNWKSNDGVAVSSSILEFNSAVQARKAFLKRLMEASMVIERRPRINEAGRKVGERAIVTFSYSGRKEEGSGILWTDGRVFHDVESFSLRHALAFEQKFYPVSNTPKSVPGRETDKPTRGGPNDSLKVK